MNRRGTLRIAAAMLALAAGGCDYWDNLFGEKRLSTAQLLIRVEDAWLRTGLAGAECRETGMGLSMKADGNGEIRMAAAPTGRYSLACTSAYYEGRRENLDVYAGKAEFTIPLGRRGGPEAWYPDSGLKVGLPPLPASLIFPRRLAWAATPSGNGKVFRYEWTFSGNPHLDRGLSKPHPKGDFEGAFQAEVANARPGADTVRLKVFADFGDGEFLAGTDSAVVEWKRNLLPELTLNRRDQGAWAIANCLDPNPFLRFGKKMKLDFALVDPDGNCLRVAMRSTDPRGAFGSLDTSFACGYDKLIELPLSDPFPPQARYADSSITFLSRMVVAAEDSNGQARLDTVELISIPNLVPKCDMGLVYPNTTYFAGERVPVWIHGRDSDSPIRLVRILWESSPVDQDSAAAERSVTDDVNEYKTELSHIFRAPGSYTLSGTIVDDCQNSGQANMTLNIRENNPPAILIDSLDPILQGATLYHRFMLSLRDRDVDDSLDRFTELVVNWGDGTQERDTTMEWGEVYENRAREHAYTAEPAQGATYRITITVRDAHFGLATAIYDLRY